MSLSENTDSAILLVSSHGRGVIEIWRRDEINNMYLGGGVSKQSIWIIWGTRIQMWSCIHENPKIWSYDAKNLLKSNLFCTALKLNVVISQCAVGASKFWTLFLVKRSINALWGALTRDFGKNCGKLAGVGTNPLISPSLRPCSYDKISNSFGSTPEIIFDVTKFSPQLAVGCNLRSISAPVSVQTIETGAIL